MEQDVPREREDATEPLDTLLPALHVISVLEGLRLEREVSERIFITAGLPCAFYDLRRFDPPLQVGIVIQKPSLQSGGFERTDYPLRTP